MKEQATKIKEGAKSALGENFSVLTDDIERLRTPSRAEMVLKVGDKTPDFTLNDAFGKEVSLNDLLAEGPVVINFYRGEWCPFCNLELRALQESLSKMESLGAKLVAISPEKADYALAVSAKHELKFPVLSDLGNKVAHQFGIVFKVGDAVKELSIKAFNNDLASRNGDESYELPIPATFVIDQNGIVRFVHADPDYMLGRVEPDTVVKELEKLSQSAAV